jgi:type I restriction enzyme, S subunit
MVSKEKITNKFPKDWQIKKLADIGSTYGGLINKSKEDFTEGNSKFITYKNIYNNTFINTDELESVRIDEDENQNKVKYGDVFFTGSSETPDEVGISSVLLEEVNDVYLNSFCFGFRFNDLKKTIPEFYGYYFRGSVFRSEVYPLAQGSTRFNLSRSEMVKLKVPIPPVKEQRKIAAILSSVDEAIEKTEAIIEQTEKVKKGLMQQLLTKGIGHTKFKKTEIGEIPEEWEVVEIGRLGEIVTGNTPKTSEPENYGNEFLWASPIDLGDEKYINQTTKMLSAKGFQKTRKVPKDSVLVTCIGSTIGKIGIASREMSTNQQINAVICNENIANYEYVYYAIDFNFQRYKAFISNQAVPIINKSLFSSFTLALPSLEEQFKIADILSTVDEKIAKEKTKYKQLTFIKKGLMQVLLTGKVRVKVNNEVMSS